MFRNYIKTAYRALLANKTYSFINIIGLSAGTLCCLYILLYVQQQYSYDRHHRDAGSIYRVVSQHAVNGEALDYSGTSSPPIAPAMKNEFAEVEKYTRVIPTISVQQHLLKYDGKSFYEKDAVFVDSSFFDIFSYHFVYGGPSKAMDAPYSVVLQQTTASKLFGDSDPVGKTITIENAYGKNDFRVMGVVDNSLGKTHLEANFFMSMNSGGIGSYVATNNVWAGNNFASAYVKLVRSANVAALTAKLPAFLEKYGGDELRTRGMKKILHLQPVTEIHTGVGYQHEPTKTASPTFLYMLILIAVLIQVIACINFMNLSTARASKRAKEVGVRKVIGAGRWDLVKQFLSESMLLAFAGVLFAVPLLIVLLPFLNGITHSDVNLSLFRSGRLWALLAALVVATGLIAGSYPAFYLSAFRAIKVIKGNFTSHISAAGIRRSLVVFQFVLSVTMVAGIIVMQSQMKYINSKDLGFDKEQKIVFNFYTDESKSRIPALMADFRNIPEVKDQSRANNYLSQFVPNDFGVYLAGGNKANSTDAQYMETDERFVHTYGIKLAAGRDLQQNDSNRVLINEALAHRLGLPVEHAPGTRLYYDDGGKSFVEVVGVMKDFNYNSLRDGIGGFMLRYVKDPSDLRRLTVSIQSDNYRAALAKMEAAWNKELPSVPFDYRFVDEELQKQYESELTLSRIINSFTLMAILISCLGLFGLAAFSAEQRRKEIGIRKVLGASAANLTALLSADFLKLVLVAILIAVPISWWLMNKWLQNFSFRISVSWWMFALAGAIAVAIALVTVSFQSIRAAFANPVKSLRTE